MNSISKNKKAKLGIFHYNFSRKGRKAAMEMSVGTIVTIVLLMTVLILGLVLVRTIFKGSVENINSIDQSVKNEINKLFSEDDSRKVVVYPATRDISIAKGSEGGFGFSIRNTEPSDQTFTYTVTVSEIPSGCQMTQQEAEGLIILGKTGSVQIPSGDSLENPVLVKFSVGESASICNIRYGLNVKQNDGTLYLPTVSVDLNIKAK